MRRDEQCPAFLGCTGFVWGLSGVLILLLTAIIRLSTRAIEALSFHLEWYHWAVLSAWIPLIGFLEGYRGFQKSFSPRVAARLTEIRRKPTLAKIVGAPFFAMGYFGIDRRRQVSAFAVTGAVLLFILVASFLDQPWRGIVDIGVSFGLSWGSTALLFFVFRRLRRQPER